MIKDEVQVGAILRELQERAKELNCLYRVDELLNRPDLPLEVIFRASSTILPPGWQYPQDCQARIIFENKVIRVARISCLPVGHKAPTSSCRAKAVGNVEVSYREQMPRVGRRPVPERRAQTNRDHRRSHLPTTSCSVA